MTRKEKIRFLVLHSLGNFLLLFSIYGVIATFGPAVSYELQFRIAQARGVQYKVADAPQVASVSGVQRTGLTPSPQPTQEVHKTPSKGFADVLSGDKEQILVPSDTEFSIVIPKIGASAKIYPNVDPTSEQIFLPVLQKGIAHAKGSVFPGMSGNTYLFAHSTDNWWHVGQYNAVFYLLKDLRVGDEIIVYFEGTRHEYVVDRTVIADPTDVSFLTQDHSGDEQLVLQTCWPPGTTWKRLYIIAKPVKK
jgi:LPXTG-site transpeptidase (sortase) family protein